MVGSSYFVIQPEQTYRYRSIEDACGWSPGVLTDGIVGGPSQGTIRREEDNIEMAANGRSAFDP